MPTGNSPLVVSWKFIGIAGLKPFLSQKQYAAQTTGTRKWYEPFQCANCITKSVSITVKDYK